jgi:L-lysine exporter family protein LysE/ArgO
MGWLMSFMSGLGTGFVLSLMLGTVFFALINNSVNYGYKTGWSMAVGVLMSDIIFIAICVFGIEHIKKLRTFDTEIGLIGGALVVVLGLYQVLNHKPSTRIREFSKTGSITFFISQGFLLNTLNPFNLVSWLAINTYVVSVYRFTLGKLILFFCGCLVAVGIAELLISFYSGLLSRKLTPIFLEQINRWTGWLFVVLGLWLILRVSAY